MAYGCSRSEGQQRAWKGLTASSVRGERAPRVNSSQWDHAAQLGREKEGELGLDEVHRVIVSVDVSLVTPMVLHWFLMNSTSQQAG